MPTELGSAHGTVVIDAQLNKAANDIAQFSRQSEKEFERVDKASKQLTSALNQMAGALGVSLSIAGAVQMGRMAFQLAETAAAAQVTEAAFDKLAAGVGASSDEIIAAMQKASHGTVADSALILGANRAIVSGVADSAAEFAQIMEIARATGQAFGFTTAEAFERLVGGISRLEGESLDELGIALRLDDVFDAYAATLNKTSAELTEAEKRQALLAEVIRDTQDAVDAAGDSAGNTSESFQQLGVAADEAGKAIGNFLNLIGAPVAVGGLALWVQQETEKLRLLQEAIERVAGAIRSIPGMDLGGLLSGGAAGIMGPVPGPAAGVGGGGGAGGKGGFADEAVANFDAFNKATQEWAAERTQIERQANADILDENNRYQSQRADMIADYEKNLTRSAANYAKQRARSIEEYEKGVARMQRDAQAQQLRMAEDHERNLARMREDHSRRLADLQEDLDIRNSERRQAAAERLADFAEDRDEGIEKARQNSADRLLEIEEDYARDRAKAIRAHEDSITEAAANLDAKAIWAEQRRFARENAEAEEAHQEKVDDEQEKLDEAIKNLNDAYAEKVADEQEALQKSIDQANAAYAKQVADANEAFAQREQDAIDSYARQAEDFQTQHEQRLSDMATDFSEEMTQRDADQAARIAEMKIDHQENLTELDTEHGERLTQIGTHAAEERGALDDEFEKRMEQLTGHEFDLELEAFKHQDRMLGGYQDYLDDVEREQTKHQIRMLRLLKETPGLTPVEIQEIDDAITDLGVALGRIGDAAHHVDPRVAPIETFLGNPDDLGGAGFITPAASGGSTTVAGTAITIAPGAIVINAAAGASVAGMGDDFERRLLAVLKKVGGV